MSVSVSSLDKCLNSLIELFSSRRTAAAEAFLTGFLPRTDVSSKLTGGPQQPQAVDFLAEIQQCGCLLTPTQGPLLHQAIQTVESSLQDTGNHEQLRQAIGLQYPDANQRQSLVLQLHWHQCCWPATKLTQWHAQGQGGRPGWP